MTASRTRGRSTRARRGAREQISLLQASSRPLLRGTDHGPPITVRSEDVGAGKRNDRWVDPFLDANRQQLHRLGLTPEIAYAGEIIVRLHPSARVGAVPLLAPSSRKVAAGLLVEPRFRWTHLGDVVSRLGFSVEPSVGGGPLVPGSAREVPPWLLAGPVLRRIEALLGNRRRDFVVREQHRTSPRGRVMWNRYLTESITTGRWHSLPCTFTEPDDDPNLMAAIRWTLDRLSQSLSSLAPTPIGRSLLSRAEVLLHETGNGPRIRPDPGWLPTSGNQWLHEATEAMGWVAEERGLGGARTLDGIAWDLAIDRVWESWVAHFSAQLAPRLGLNAIPDSALPHYLHWQGNLRSMGALIPDVGLRSAERAVWIDAKYKAHLTHLARSQWPGLTDDMRDAHRADLHQAIAYASLAQVDRVDTVLAYPLSPDETATGSPSAVATLASGRRRVRVLIAGIPFGFRSPSHEERTLADWTALLAS